MMKPRWIPFLISSAILFASRGEGYELHTHVRLSQHAFDAATALGFYLADLELTTNQAFDPDGKAKQSTAFANFDNAGTARDWLAAGAIREDDFLRHPFLENTFGCPRPEIRNRKTKQ